VKSDGFQALANKAIKIIRSKEFTANRPWGALDIANMSGITTRLHWTDQP